MKNPNNREDLRHHQKIRQSFRGHWAHSHIIAKHNKQKHRSVTTTGGVAIDPARSFFKQLSESTLCGDVRKHNNDHDHDDDVCMQMLDSVNEFELRSQEMHDLPSSVF